MPLGKREPPSDRSFGLLVAGAGAVFSVAFLRTGRPLGAEFAGLVAVAMASVALLKPGFLAPINKAWISFGKTISRVTTPIILGILFFGLFTPLALLLRVFGRDELRLRRGKGAESYWRPRDPPGPGPASFHRQF